jgi:hypothetical protein
MVAERGKPLLIQNLILDWLILKWQIKLSTKNNHKKTCKNDMSFCTSSSVCSVGSYKVYNTKYVSKPVEVTNK